METTKKLRFVYAGNGISFSEQGDNNFTGHISKTRHISIIPGKTFTQENLQKIYDMADSGNMIFTSGETHKYLVLNPIHKPTKEYINSLTNEVFQLSIEIVDGKEYVCTQNGIILSETPEKYQDIPKISNPHDKKYELTNYTKVYDGQTLYRIRALKDFGGVKAGEIGGYVAGEHNLSQYKNSWIKSDSMVFNLAYVGDNALVSNSIMYGNAKAIENSRVIQTTMYGDSQIKGCAIANNAYIYDHSNICGESRVSGHLAFEGIIRDKVFIKDPGVRITGKGIELSDEVQISDNVQVDGHAKIRGKSRIMGYSEITDYAEIAGEGIIIKDNVCVGGKSRIWDNVILAGDVKINGRALVRDKASLYDNVLVCDAVEIFGEAKIKDKAIISGCSVVGGCAKVSGDAIITDYAQIYSHAQIRGHAQVKGNAKLTDFASACENSCIDGDVILSGDTIVKGNTHINTQEQANKLFKPSITKVSSNEISL